jgi:putative DNA primase/helicase
MIALPDFSIYCEAACIEYWGQPDKKNFKELRWGKPDGYSGRSFNFKKKRWYDRDAKRGGSTLTLIALEEGLTDQKGKADVRGKRFFEAWRIGYQKKIIAEPPPEPRGGGKDIRAVFPYRDENGAHLYDVVRFNTDEVDERFRYRLPSGEWKLGKTRRVLYRLPELIAAIKAGERVLVCEGERDANAAVKLGYAATTNCGGIGRWRSAYDGFFKGADVVVVADNDQHGGGREHAAEVAEHVQKIAARVRVVMFPQKDLTEWAEAGGTREQLDALIAQATDYAPQAQASAGLEDQVALDFAALHTDDYRYVAQTSHWFRWNATRWQAEKTLAAFDVSRTLCRQAGDSRAKTVAAVVTLARTDRRIAATVEQWDRDPDLLNAAGIVIDLKNGTERPPDRLDYCTKQTGVAPAPPGTLCELFLKFLDRVTHKDGELIGFLQRYLGYCLTGHVHEHVLAFFFGTGANGKGTFIRAVSAILNGYCTVSPIEMFLRSRFDRHPTEVARLHKVRLTVAQETPKSRAWDEAKIKNMTGGDVMTGRFMRADFFDFEPTHKLIIAGNHKPTLLDIDEAFRRRFLLVPFTVTIPEGERDPALSDKLRPEHPAILRWMIDGCLQWRQGGLGIPPRVRDASDRYFAEQDDLTHWLDDCTEHKPRSFTTASALFRSWQKWCGECGALPGTQRSFTDTLQDRGYHYHRTNQSRGFKDLALKSGGETQMEGDFG